ncbi:MAG TPA: hypothetical protein VKU00_34545 [Chthonomonadaceae bacterium]|nr:hypothetical protein [Chthonomonadaceae bacterium]
MTTGASNIGSSQWNGQALTLTGGAGLNGKDGDQAYFVYVTRTADDFETEQDGAPLAP